MWKKYLLLVYLFFLITGCFSKNKEIHIETIIEEKSHYKVSINYPKTGYSLLDDSLEKYIDNIYHFFIQNKNQENSLDTLEELNIDYTLYQNKQFFSITLFTSINDTSEIKTFNYNYIEDKFFSLKDLNNTKNIYSKANTILFHRFGNILEIEKIKENLNTELFSIDENNLYLYYQKNSISSNYQDIIIIDIPLKDINLKFNNLQKTSLEVSERKVNTEKVNKIIDTNSKVIALTFDDGPSYYTKDIIHILKENDAVATFFILGNKVKLYEDTLKLSIEYGNEIGNHTYNHKWLTKLNDEEIKKQIQDTQDIIEETLGITPTLFRPSYGSINKRVRNDIDLDIVLWNIDTMDWKYKSVDKIVDRAVRNASDGKIILMHETYSRTRDALSKIISILKEKEFTFVTISELKEIQNIRKQNGKQ